jgi:hypothetical protein
MNARERKTVRDPSPLASAGAIFSRAQGFESVARDFPPQQATNIIFATIWRYLPCLFKVINVHPRQAEHMDRHPGRCRTFYPMNNPENEKFIVSQELKIGLVIIQY